MTATRNRITTVLAGQDAEIPLAADFPERTYCALDTNITYFSTGAEWIRISSIGAPPAAQHPPAVLDYDVGNTSQWRLAQVKGTWSLTFSSTIRRIPSGLAGRFEVRSGDDPLNLGSGTERSEVLGPFFDEGEEVYIGWSTYFPDGTPIGEHLSLALGIPGTGKTNTFMDFHENRGATGQFPTTADLPPFEMNVDTQATPKVRLRVVGGTETGAQMNIHVTPPVFYDIQNPVVYNAWTDYVVHIIHSSDPTIGGFEIWVNGSRPASVPGWQTLATKYVDRQNYLKQGWYRTANAGTSVVYHDMTVLDFSYGAVDPSRFD